MKFNQIHRVLIIIFVLCYKIIRGDNSEEAKKWHIIGKTLHYIEVERKYYTYDAFHFCRGIGMINYIGYENAAEFGKYLESSYGYVPSLWSANQENCELRRLLRREMKNETKFNYAIKTIVNYVSCSAKYGFVCSANISNGVIQFKNGTQLSINRDDVIKYCDPQAEHVLDQQNCLIVFDQILL